MSEDHDKPVYEIIREKCELAVMYAEDGAYGSAARVLKEVAKMTSVHSKCIQKMMEEMS